ncbi:hypothetical protein EII14_04285 [Alloprevotella sp. OH1205_COT-284]|uniref:hypothetical protein n=1 Tax=Alloprevotella sp. OH1205_COT-284 TaxID=2491043 RepID=UPI000F5D6102|nr:hypothetical protein [Alloprevotella sp. OH1205_COT-284]RRD79975.1 hypothetical protein EII14_04285 [Alloprevotella sp. OH1205_COT-284]
MNTTFVSASSAASRRAAAFHSEHRAAFHIVDILVRRPWVKRMAVFYSGLLGEDISPRLALCLLNTQLSFSVALLPFSFPVWWHVLTVAWCVWSGGATWRLYRKVARF